MVASQNLCRNRKCPITDNNKVPKMAVKKMQTKIAFFATKFLTSTSSPDIGEISFTSLDMQCLNVITPSKIPLKESKFSCFHMQQSDELKPLKQELPVLYHLVVGKKQRHSTNDHLPVRSGRFLATKNQLITYSL